MESGSETQMDLNNNTCHQNDHSIMEMGFGNFGYSSINLFLLKKN